MNDGAVKKSCSDKKFGEGGGRKRDTDRESGQEPAEKSIAEVHRVGLEGLHTHIRTRTYTHYTLMLTHSQIHMIYTHECVFESVPV